MILTGKTQATVDEEKIIADKANAVQEAKSYLASTDWIVAKIGEAQMKGGDISQLLAKYAPDLQKREEARTTINEVEV